MFPSPITRGANLVATLPSANKHSRCRRPVCRLNSEAKEHQQQSAPARSRSRPRMHASQAGGWTRRCHASRVGPCTHARPPVRLRTGHQPCGAAWPGGALRAPSRHRGPAPRPGVGCHAAGLCLNRTVIRGANVMLTSATPIMLYVQYIFHPITKFDKWYVHFDHLDESVTMVQSKLAFDVVCDNTPFYSIIANLHLQPNIHQSL
jgi:hypothetical protein